MSETYVKRYDVGNIRLDTPYAHFIYELPLLTFGDIQHTIGLSLVFNSRLAGTNPFSMANGYKLNLQKNLYVISNYPILYGDGDGSVHQLTNNNGIFTFDDRSQRVLRCHATGFILENPDYSQEIFDSYGNILAIKDKYGRTYLNYSYTFNKLSSITYRDTKKISITYDSNSGNINTLSYLFNNSTVCSLSFTYPNENSVNVVHYSGITYATSLSSNIFTAYSMDGSGIYESTSYRLTCTTEDNSITVKKEKGSTVLDRVVYAFSLNSSDDWMRLLDITDFYGHKTRIQFQDKVPIYSYEPDGDNPSSAEQPYAGKVAYYGCDNIVNFSSLGISKTQGIENGVKMYRMCEGGFNHYLQGTTLPDNYDGPLMLSGWIMNRTNLVTDIELRVNNASLNLNQAFDIKDAPPNKWVYFSLLLPYNSDHDDPYIIQAGTYLTDSELSIRDFRLSIFDTNIEDENGKLHTMITEEVVILKDDNDGLNVFPMHQVTFENCGRESDTDYVYLDDIMRFRINQAKNVNTQEFYFNNGKKISLVTPSNVTIRYNNETYSLSSCYFGRRIYQYGNAYITRIRDDLASNIGLFAVDLLDGDGNVYNTKIYNSKGDLTSEVEGTVTVTYSRNAYGFVLVNEVSDSSTTPPTTWNQIAEYDETSRKLLSITDEFGKCTSYTTDDVWGVISKITSNDGIQVTDTYDGDAFALTSRSFFNSGSYREHSFGYDGEKVNSITSGTLDYSFGYSFDEITSVSKNDYPMIQTTISSDKKTRFDYHPEYSSYNYYFTHSYDKYKRLTAISEQVQCLYDVSPTYEKLSVNNENSASVSEVDKYKTYSYNDGSAKLAQMNDLVTGKFSKYAYNYDQLSRIGVFDSNENKIEETTFSYDEIGRETEYSFTSIALGNKEYKVQKDYLTDATSPLADNRIEGYTTLFDNSAIMSVISNYDQLKRVSSKYVDILDDNRIIKSFTYQNSRPQAVNYRINGNSNHSNEYSFDDAGRITQDTYTSPNLSYENQYIYDYLGQLIRENNEALDKTFVYCYDSIGNISSVMTYDYTTDTLGDDCTEQAYVYDTTHPDRLISIGDKSITYNSLHCPSNYNGNAFTWTRGKLTAIQRGNSMQPGSLYERCEFGYNGYGQRISKNYTYDPNPASTSDYSYSYNTVYNYDSQGRLIREYCAEAYISGSRPTREFIYLYDENEIIGFLYSLSGATAQPYYYKKNLQGDVVAIYDATGNRKVEYAYDAFGNCKVIYTNNADLANSNPIRYRSYYYDRETKLYYLQSRYYNPEWRRFISPDSTDYIDPESINGLNLYAYCNNDPVNYADPSGHWLETLLDLFSLGMSIVEVIINPYDPLNWAGLAGDAFDLIPFVTGVGETVRGVRIVRKGIDLADNTYDTIRFMKAIDRAEDFSDNSLDIAKTLGKTSDGFTISNKLDGIRIHRSFMGNGRIIPGSRLRLDGINDISKTIYELKPYNRANLRKGVKQILNYNNKLGGSYKMMIVFY